ncbi:MAG: hypothetical protein RLZ55_1274, partial [Actinomycetota bacterium]
MGLVRLSNEWCDLIVDTSGGVPAVVHWGAPLGAEVDLDTVAAALRRPVTSGALDVVAPLSLVPEHGSGHPGRPGLLGHRRRGVAWAPRFVPAGTELDAAGRELVVRAVDPVAGLELVSELRLGEALEVSCTLTNTGTDRYLLDALTVCVPMPAHAAELMTLHGRWIREFHTERRPWTTGSWTS